MPSMLFWEWFWRTILRIFTFSAVIGIAWSLISLVQFGDIDPGDFRFIISYFIDTTVVYALVFGTFFIGLTMHMWGVIGELIALSRKRILTGYLWSIFASLSMNLIIVNIMIRTDVAPVTTASVTLTTTVTAIIAQSTAFSAYYEFAVLNRSDRSEFNHRKASRNKFLSFVMFFVPAPREGRLFLGIVSGAVLTPLSIWLSLTVATLVSNGFIKPIIMSLIMGLTFGLHGLLIRLFDAIRPGSKKASLYPHFETER